MPFLQGPGPIRRTLPYLKSGTLIFKDRVKIMEIHCNWYPRRHAVEHLVKYGNAHEGLNSFHFWNVPQIQYQNPDVQIIRFLDMTPNPFIRCWLDSGKNVLFDCYEKTRYEILLQLAKTLGKSKERLKMESDRAKDAQDYDNPAHFGFNKKQFCICEVPGQVPCPGTCELPKKYLGYYNQYKPEELEKWNQDLDAPYLTEKQKQTKFHWFPPHAKPVIENLPDIEKPFLREFGKTPGKDIAPPESYYEWKARQEKKMK
ncbi:probable 28S ribosomal protein S25, mitochondrial [Tetranychus urticae]|uniref:Small ribosomal subunit protein mS25 n=1 Tax=Tetranychus urticae TaxID=32264 RepID=T1K0M9_TETUR|nr:probable 28S ribosomal protein S25, mitochondrial [Tetranychus urticae]